MKKIYSLLLFALIISSQCLIAQDLDISPNPVYKDGVTAGDVEAVGYSDIYNNSGSDLNLTWNKNVIEMTEGWDVAVCDVVQCYLPTVDSQTFDLAAGTAGTMDVHVYPNGIEGAAIIEVEVYETNDPSNSTTGVYYFNQVIGVAEKFSEAIKVYPNPTQDFITIDNSESLVSIAELYNVSGKLMMRTNLNGNDRISIQELPAANYILKLSDANGTIVSTNLIVKE